LLTGMNWMNQNCKVECKWSELVSKRGNWQLVSKNHR